MAIFHASTSVLKIETTPGSGTYTTVAVLVDASISQSATPVVATDLLQHTAGQFVTGDNMPLNYTIDASGFLSDDATHDALHSRFADRQAFSARLYTDTAIYFQGTAKITSLTIGGAHSGPVSLSISLVLSGVLKRRAEIIVTAADAAAGDLFGQSVAMSGGGSVLVVGAPYWEGATADQGGVYVYDKSGATWIQRGSVLTASDAATSDEFGHAVALSADGLVLAVGARSWEGGATPLDVGGVYTYDYTGGAWVQRGSVLTVYASNDSFGSAVALSRDGLVMAVGAYEYDGGLGDAGGVYIFDYSGGSWVQRGSVLTPADRAALDEFGSAVALNDDGSMLVVGSPGDDDTASGAGSVYIFDYSGGSWSQRAKIQPATPVAGENFGNSVALSSDGLTLFVGAWLNDDNGTDAGRVYRFAISGGTATSEELLAPDGGYTANARSGSGVACGSSAAAYAFAESYNGAGRVFTY